LSSAPTPDWSALAAPSIEDLDALAQVAYRRLPAEFRALCGDVVVRVVDFPDDDTLASMGIGSPFDLLGLYHGVSLDRKSVHDVVQSPDMVFLYRRPILDYWAEHDETLGAIVTHILVHEIGHHFGLSDDDMYRIEEEAV
jgi:predicted Zn-dependent protease with MMP-like domain